jgi:uncharacterized RDD family membrane protein YckC
MKCPKCGYLGFERVDRCRNCGYDFSLLHQPPAPELPIRTDTGRDEHVDDLTLIDSATVAQPLTDFNSELDPPINPTPRPRSKPFASELPLFGSPVDDEPLITKVSPPRPPLAVRRATPEVPRLRAEPRAQSLDLTLDPSTGQEPTFSPAARAKSEKWPTYKERTEPSADAGVAARFVAVVIDLLILGAVDAAVIYFTMQICGLTLADIDILPKGPLIAFLLVQNGGYLVTFTAGGQTLGKMAAGIRVVSARSESNLDLGRAVVRTTLWLLLAIPAGLGFLTAVLSRDHRGLHDRLAGTRVVR